MITKLTEVVGAISHALHVTKPLLVELMLFVWAIIEISKFMWQVALGGHGG